MIAAFRDHPSSPASHPEQQNDQQTRYDARAQGPEDVPLVPPLLEIIARTPAGRFAHRAGIDPLKLIVQRDVYAKGRRLHAENIDESRENQEQPRHSDQRPHGRKRSVTSNNTEPTHTSMNSG